MNESKYQDDDYVLYYVKGILVSGHIEFNIKFDTIGDDTVTMTVPDYYEIPAQITKIYSTGTTATGIVAYG